MKCPYVTSNVFGALKKVTFGFIFLAAFFVVNNYSQAGTSALEAIDTDSIIIAMDNDRQGDVGACNGPVFNIRAYGLAVRLLHANVPLKWAIKDKLTKDEADFTASATQLVGDIGGGFNVGGQDCTTEGVNTPFSGGPLIITAEYRAAALQVIEDFNNGPSNNDDVRVYEVDAGFVAPIRYTLTHKPFAAVGPDGGGFGPNTYQDLFVAAGLQQDNPGTPAVEGHFGLVANNIFTTNTCVTLAAQAHASADAINFIGTYRTFAEAGGNLLLQCHSVNVFENHVASGRFQTTLGWTVFGTDGGNVVGTINTFPNPAMPFNQFIGELADQQGMVSEYELNTNPNPDSVFQNGTLISARNNTAGNTNKYVATVSRIGNAVAGGSVFELGGHDYDRTDATNTAIGRANGNRMALNTLLMPAFRQGCGLAINSVVAFKSVAMSVDINNNTLPNFGDTVEWTVRYINDGTVPVTNFQVTDSLDTLGPGVNRLAYVPGSLTVTPTGSGTSATANLGYSPNGNINTLAAGATLNPGGLITIKFKTVIQGYGEIANQATGTGTGINTPVKTDTTDASSTGTVAGYNVECPGDACLSQAGYSGPGNEDPTKIDLGLNPTAADASVSGIVVDANGRGIAREQIVLQNATSGELRSAITNSFGRFNFNDVSTGEFYILSIRSKRYRYTNSSFSFDLVDNLNSIVFSAVPDRFDLPNNGSVTKSKGMSR